MDNFYDMWRVFFEAIPVMLALVSVMISVETAITTIDSSVRKLAWMFSVCSGLLITAQTSWSWSLFIKKSLLGTDTANVVWSLFNILVMISMIYTLKSVVKK